MTFGATLDSVSGGLAFEALVENPAVFIPEDAGDFEAALAAYLFEDVEAEVTDFNQSAADLGQDANLEPGNDWKQEEGSAEKKPESACNIAFNLSAAMEETGAVPIGIPAPVWPGPAESAPVDEDVSLFEDTGALPELPPFEGQRPVINKPKPETAGTDMDRQTTPAMHTRIIERPGRRSPGAETIFARGEATMYASSTGEEIATVEQIVRHEKVPRENHAEPDPAGFGTENPSKYEKDDKRPDLQAWQEQVNLTAREDFRQKNAGAEFQAGELLPDIRKNGASINYVLTGQQGVAEDWPQRSFSPEHLKTGSVAGMRTAFAARLTQPLRHITSVPASTSMPLAPTTETAWRGYVAVPALEDSRQAPPPKVVTQAAPQVETCQPVGNEPAGPQDFRHAPVEESAEPPALAEPKKAQAERKGDRALTDKSSDLSRTEPAKMPARLAEAAHWETTAPATVALKSLEPQARPPARLDSPDFRIEPLETHSPSLEPVRGLVREIALRLSPDQAPGTGAAKAGKEKVELKLMERGGGIHFVVRTNNPALADSLRDGLPTLVKGLEQAGFETGMWQLGAALSENRTGQLGTPEPESGAAPQDGSGRGSQGSPDKQDRHGQHQEPEPGWVEALERSFDRQKQQALRSVLYGYPG